ncbi:MAG: orotidine-5'-phosphate decarboxylase [Candidatus Omnitrophota bacterium]|jgi:orotidine-5'-phosphate decarboxylase
MKARERLIVALDAHSYERSAELVDILSPEVDIFKVGIAPFTGYGSRILEKLEKEGKKVFLDLKVHDIPNTVENTAYIAAAKGVFMLNFHCLGGVPMLEAAVRGAKEGSKDTGKEAPILLGVTVLTSMGEEDLKAIGLGGSVGDKVLGLARLAAAAGLDGVVASAREAEAIKKTLGKDFVIVVPGIRPEWAARGDQKRTGTPGEAIAKGADYIVVGRPVIGADDPLEAAKKIIEEMERP